jgi:hypothetical protein
MNSRKKEEKKLEKLYEMYDGESVYGLTDLSSYLRWLGRVG